MTKLPEAVRAGAIDDVRARLAAGDDVGARDEHGATLLHHAPSAAIVDALLAAGADADALDGEGKAPLYWHAADHAIVERLLQAGARADRVASLGGATPLHRAAEADAAEAVRLMLASGAAVDVETVGGYFPGRTPLHRAAATGAREAALVLLDAGADPNRPDAGRPGFEREGGTTPVHCAAEEGHAETLQLLLERGGDPHLEDHAGRTALQRAEDQEDADVLAVLERHAEGALARG